jgi:outer membrane biosynthesis protein TonB
MLTASLMVNDLSHASPQPSKAAASGSTSGKTDAVHLVVHSGPEAKQIFTYFPYPDIPAQYRFAKISGTGIYRLTISPQGNVVEIKILKKMGVFGDWPADVTALKTLIHWRAQPGPPRIVDVPWSITPGRHLLPTKDRISQGAKVLVFQLTRKETP